MKNQVQRDGKIIDYPCTGTVLSGAVIDMQHMIGVALTDGVNGDTISVSIDGIFELPKVSGAVFAIGEKLLWDDSANAFDDSLATPATNDIMGAVVAVRQGLNGETTCWVKLTPGNATRT
jgi:predicted RecA/RadA family phage recombinase